MTKTVDPLVLVVPRTKVPAWKGEEPATVPTYEYMRLSDALRVRSAFQKDWCIQPVTLWDMQDENNGTERSSGPRLGSAALARFANNTGIQATLNAALIDLDFDGHTEPPDGWAEEVSAMIPWPHGWYRSPNGMRLVFLPARRVPILKGNAYLTKLCTRLEEFGVPHIDPTTQQALRLQRTMHALGRDLPYDLSGLAPLEWHPSLEDLDDSPAMNIKHWPGGHKPSRVDAPTSRAVKSIRNTRLRQQVLEGRVPARNGERHKTLLEVAMVIANQAEIDDPEILFSWLYASAERMFREERGRPWDVELWAICQWAIAGVKSAEEEARAARKGAIEDAAEAMCVTVEKMMRQMILAGDDFYFIWSEEKMMWQGPFKNKDHLHMLLREHAPSLAASVSTKDDFGTVLRWYGSHVRELAYSYNPADVGLYDGILTCLAAPVRPIMAKYHAGVDSWLRAFGGDREERWMDWLATLPDRSRPSCGIYINSDQGCGKNLLGYAISELWTHDRRHVVYDDVEKFPLAFQRTPFVWANESSEENSSGLFRRLVGDGVREVNVKHFPKFSLRGYPVFLVTANNDEVLNIKENVTNADLDAIRLRIGYLSAGSKPREVLHQVYRQENDGRWASLRSMTEEWMHTDAITGHLMWLYENRDVTPDDRFVIEGWSSRLTDALQTKSGDTSTVLTVIIQAILKNKLGNAVVVRPQRKDIGVSSLELANVWADAIGSRSDRPPSVSVRRKVLGELADPGQPQLRHEGARFTRITWESLVQHARNLGDVDIASLEECLGAVQRINERRAEMQENGDPANILHN